MDIDLTITLASFVIFTGGCCPIHLVQFAQDESRFVRWLFFGGKKFDGHCHRRVDVVDQHFFGTPYRNER